MLRRIYENAFNGQMMVTIPKDNELGLSKGMYVAVARAQPPPDHRTCKVCGKGYTLHTLDELVKHGLWVK
jgi:hypothetical protein